jgi:DNA-directed RNA polymerase specialized sigma24 family protein
MQHHLQAVVRSLEPRPACIHAAAPIAVDEETLQQAMATQRDALRRFIVLQLVPAQDGALNAHAFIAESRRVLRERGELAHAAWQFGIAATIAVELARATVRELAGPAASGVRGLEGLSRVGRRRAAERLAAAFAGLGDDLRDLMLAVALRELSLDEAGMLLTQRLTVTRARTARAVRALGRHLQEDGFAAVA